MAIVNEPPTARRANAYVVLGELRHGGARLRSVGVYAGKCGVDAHSEVTMHYGCGYAVHRARKKYVAGLPSLMSARVTPCMEAVMLQIVAAGGRRLDTMFEVPAESSDGEAAGDKTYKASRGRPVLPKRSQPPRRGVIGRDSVTSAEAPAGAACPPTIAEAASAGYGS